MEKKKLPTLEVSTNEIQEEVIVPQKEEIPQKPSLPSRVIPLRKKLVIKKKDGVPVIMEKTKMDLFLEEYVNNNGNGTEAAMKVFATENRVNAANLASAYLKKARVANRLLLEKKGFTQGRMLDVAISKMQMSKVPDWWDRIMKMGDYEDFISKNGGGVTTNTVNIMEIQKDMIDQYMGDAVIEGETVK